MDFKDSRLLAPPAQVNFKSAERQTPAFTMQAVQAGIVLSAGAGAVAFVSVLALAVGINWAPAWRVALVSGGFVALTVLTYYIVDLLPPAMWQTETITGHDLNQDKIIGELPPQPTTPFLYRKGPGQITAGDWGITPELFTEWCRAGYREQSLAFGKWVCRFGQVYPGNGRKAFETFRGLWQSRGYGEDRGGNKGFGFTGEGMDHAAGWLFSQGLLQPLEPTPLPAQLGTGESE